MQSERNLVDERARGRATEPTNQSPRISGGQEEGRMKNDAPREAVAAVLVVSGYPYRRSQVNGRNERVGVAFISLLLPIIRPFILVLVW